MNDDIFVFLQEISWWQAYTGFSCGADNNTEESSFEAATFTCLGHNRRRGHVKQLLRGFDKIQGFNRKKYGEVKMSATSCVLLSSWQGHQANSWLPCFARQKLGSFKELPYFGLFFLLIPFIGLDWIFPLQFLQKLQVRSTTAKVVPSSSYQSLLLSWLIRSSIHFKVSSFIITASNSFPSQTS